VGADCVEGLACILEVHLTLRFSMLEMLSALFYIFWKSKDHPLDYLRAGAVLSDMLNRKFKGRLHRTKRCSV
jgi:hypothetical protein